MTDDMDIRDLIQERLDVSSRENRLRKKRAEWHRNRAIAEEVERLKDMGSTLRAGSLKRVAVANLQRQLDELKAAKEKKR